MTNTRLKWFDPISNAKYFANITQKLKNDGVGVVGETESKLIEASRRGNTDTVEALLQEGVDVNQAGADGSTPLIVASAWNRSNIYEILVENGADVNATDNRGWTALHVAVDMSHKEAVTTLLQNGADQNIINEDGKKALDLAREQEIIDILEEKAAEDAKKRESESRLSNTSRRGDEDSVKALLEEGVNVNAKDEDGRTPLWLVSKEGHLATVKVLLENGAKVNEPDNYGETPLSISCMGGRSEVVDELIKRGGDVNNANENGTTPLMEASAANHSNIIDMLIENGVDINAKNIVGWTALHKAAYWNKKDAVINLLEKGADPNLTDTGAKTALNLAKYPEIIAILKEKAAANRLTLEESDEGKGESDSSQLEVLLKEKERCVEERVRLRAERDELLLAKRQGTDRDTAERIVSQLERLAELVKEIPPGLVRNEYNFNTSNTNYGERAGYQFFNIGQSPLAEELTSKTGEGLVHLTIRIAQLESELLTKDSEIEDLITRNETVETNDEVQLRVGSSKAGTGLAEETEAGLREKIEWLTEAFSRLQTELSRTKGVMDRLEADKDSQLEELRAENAAQLKELVEMRERVCGLSAAKVEQRTEIVELEKRVKQLQRASIRVSALLHSPVSSTWFDPR